VSQAVPAEAGRMTAAPAGSAAAQPLCVVLARLGGLHIGVPVQWVAAATASRAELTALPRRQGAVAGLLQTEQGCVPVVDLARWVTLPETASPAELQRVEPCYLTLHQGSQRLALRVDELLGLRRVPARQVQRLHHQDDPEELFDAVLPALGPDEPPVCLLEPQRLMQLLAIWCEDSPETGEAATNDSTATRGAQPLRLAIIRTGAQRLALDMRHIAELMPMPALTVRLAPGGASMGFADWRDSTLAVLNPGWPLGLPVLPLAAPLALVIRNDGGLALALPVDELLGTTAMPAETVPAEPGAAAWRGCRWMEDGQQVELLDAPALLEALPESALARPTGRRRLDTRQRNEQPYFIVQAARTVALPIRDVLAVLEVGTLPPHQGTLDWRERQLPLHTPAGTASATMVAVIEHAGQPTAVRIHRLVGLVPAGAAEISSLPGAPGAQMLSLAAQEASYAVVQGRELLATSATLAA
jgi:chemotaxis signal transduction protein